MKTLFLLNEVLGGLIRLFVRFSPRSFSFLSFDKKHTKTLVLNCDTPTFTSCWLLRQKYLILKYFNILFLVPITFKDENIFFSELIYLKTRDLKRKFIFGGIMAPSHGMFENHWTRLPYITFNSIWESKRVRVSRIPSISVFN